MIDKDLYHKQGYYIAKNVIPNDLIQNYLNDVNAILKNSLQHKNIVFDNDLHGNLQKLLQCDTQFYLTSVRLAAKLVSLKKITQHENILSLIKQLGITLPIMQYQPVTHINSPKLQIPGGYDGLEAHQDFSSLQSSLDFVTLWLPFVDITDETVSLDVFPGSHRRGLLSGKEGGNELVVDESYYRDEDFLTVRMNAGDLLLFSAFTIHRTQKNKENISGLRFAASVRYENAMEKTFIAREYPCCEKKIMEHDILYPNFPKEIDLQAIFS